MRLSVEDGCSMSLLAVPTTTDESSKADQCPQLLYIYVVLALETEKERQHRPGFCPMVTQAVAKSVSKGLRKPAVGSNGAVPRRDAEVTSCKKEPHLPQSLVIDHGWPLGACEGACTHGQSQREAPDETRTTSPSSPRLTAPRLA